MRIPVIGLRVIIATMVLATTAALASIAEAAPKASIVMDLRNGKVLQAQAADRKLHPASLTKMMTVYLAFEAIRDGQLRLDQKLRVSRHAARQPASKLYLKAGQRVTVRSLIRATAIKSANDAAMVLAEAIGGSQKGFARLMNRKAKTLGMRNTRFKNPHGLTQGGHYSTARDMAILGRHLFFDYPQYYNIFKRRTDFAAGKRIWNTNRLLSTYPGADGIKTGYTRAAGYNLVATAHRGKKRIIAVQFGARNSTDRARKVARLLDIGFSRAKRSVKRVRPRVELPSTRVAIRQAPVPLRKPRAPLTGLAAVKETLAAPQAQAASRPAAPASIFAPKVAELPRARPIAMGEAVRIAKTPPPRLREEIVPTPSRPIARKIDEQFPIPLPRPVKLSKHGPPGFTARIGPFASEADALARLVDMADEPAVTSGTASFQIAKARGRKGRASYHLDMPNLTEAEAILIYGAVSGANPACNVVR